MHTRVAAAAAYEASGPAPGVRAGVGCGVRREWLRQGTSARLCLGGLQGSVMPANGKARLSFPGKIE